MKLPLLLVTITTLINPGFSLLNREEPPLIEIKQSVDEDLKSFNFDYKRYQVGSNRIYQPILINYLEASSKDYYDLLYFYDPNNEFEINSISVDISASNNVNDLKLLKTKDYELIETGLSSDKTIKRYAFKGYEDYRLNSYRKYDLKSLNYNDKIIELNNAYLFNDKNQEYSNCLNVRLEDPHAWSWHFDEDSLLENTWESFLKWAGYGASDTLKDQLFYSFYVSNWNINEIKSIDMMYKKVLLEGVRYNEADLGSAPGFYTGNCEHEEHKAKFYQWNDSNSLNNYDKSNLLGYSLSEIGSKVDFTKKTITSSKANSVGIGHNYIWNTIQDKNSFKNAFGENSDIYKFADAYFKNESENYWIINFDDFFYNYSSYMFINQMYTGFNEPYGNERCSILAKYCEDNNVHYKHETTSLLGSGTMVSDNYYIYKFIQEYCFDIQATNITFEDSNCVEYSLPVSVAPVDEEASGGFSEYPTLPNHLGIITSIIIGIIIVLSVFLISKLIFFISDQRTNKLLKENLKQVKKKRKKK